MLNHNLNLTSRRFELQAYVDVINTADAYKLSRLSKYIGGDKTFKYFAKLLCLISVYFLFFFIIYFGRRGG